MAQARIDLQKAVYTDGEWVNGFVALSVTKALPYRSAVMSLIGKERTEVRYQSGDNRRTAVEESVFLNRESPMILPKDEEGRISPGEYNIPFRFMLSEGLPASYRGRNSKILYTVTAHIDVPLDFDVRDSLEIEVISRSQTSESRPIDACSDSWGDPRSVGISFKADKWIYGRGEVLSGTCAFRNPDSKNLRKIDVSLKWIETASAKRHNAIAHVAEEVVEIPIGGKVFKGETPFSIRVPEDAPLTFEGSLSSLRCLLRLNLDIALASDVKAVIAIAVVGITRGAELPRVYGREGWSGDLKEYPREAYEAGYRDRLQGSGREVPGQKVVCPRCGGNVRSPDATFCPYCGARMSAPAPSEVPRVRKPEVRTRRVSPPKVQGVGICTVCGMELGHSDQVVWCPHCGKLAHREHLMEWIHTNKSCPACGKRLDEEDYE